MNRFNFLTLVFVSLAAGCAGPTALDRQRQLAREQESEQQIEPWGGELASARFSPPASALVFDLPVAWDVPPLNLDRESRQPGAFVGFEGPSVEYHTILIDNRQNVGNGLGVGSNNCDQGDSYNRQDIIQRTSVRYR